jgi:hypothetical protein
VTHPIVTEQAIVLTGREIDWIRSKTIAIGLETWAKHKMKVNRAYTPKRMMAAAEKITGQKFKAGDYLGAARAIRSLVEAERRMILRQRELEQQAQDDPV